MSRQSAAMGIAPRDRYETEHGQPATPPPAYCPRASRCYSAATATGTTEAHYNNNDKEYPALLITWPPDDPCAALGDFNTVILIDDSSSMSGSRWRQTKRTLKFIASSCAMYDEDGIDIHFLNHPTPQYNITNATDISEIFDEKRPLGSKPTGRRMREIVCPYIDRLERRIQQCKQRRVPKPQWKDHIPKPMNLIVITDGCPTDRPEDDIAHFARRLKACSAAASQLGIQFVQVGHDRAARQYLRDLRDKLPALVGAAGGSFRDIVDIEPCGSIFHNLSGEKLLKIVLGSFIRRLDRTDG